MTDHSKLVERLRDKKKGCPTCDGVDPKSCVRCRGQFPMWFWYIEEAATALESRSDDYKRGLEDAAKIAGKKGGFHHIGDDAVYWNGYSRGREEAEAEIRAKIKGGAG